MKKIIAAVVVSLTVACGGGGDDETDATPPANIVEYIIQNAGGVMETGMYSQFQWASVAENYVNHSMATGTQTQHNRVNTIESDIDAQFLPLSVGDTWCELGIDVVLQDIAGFDPLTQRVGSQITFNSDTCNYGITGVSLEATFIVAATDSDGDATDMSYWVTTTGLDEAFPGYATMGGSALPLQLCSDSASTTSGGCVPTCGMNLPATATLPQCSLPTPPATN